MDTDLRAASTIVDAQSAVSWGAIAAGAVGAAALSFVLIAFGAGLGLSITRAIVAAHGGILRLERPARGTRWHIDLPFAEADADNEPSPLVTTDG